MSVPAPVPHRQFYTSQTQATSGRRQIRGRCSCCACHTPGIKTQLTR